MVTPHQRSKKNSLKPLFFKTPLLDGESITSWLIRASFRQGCSNLTFTYHYWQDYRLWTYDVDKGFNHVDEQIHADMACLAETEVERFDKQTLNYFAEQTNTLNSAKNVGNQWVLPLSKRNRQSLLGYQYCPVCFMNEKNAYLPLNWRFSWYVYCPNHAVSMECRCPHCNAPYQPNLIPTEIKSFNYCHACQNKLFDNYSTELPVVSNAYQLQKKALQVLEEQKAIIFDEIVSVADCFELMLFYINIARKASKTKNDNYMLYRLLVALGINTEDMDINYPALEDSDTGLIFDYLPLNERIRFMNYANMLMLCSVEQWLNACEQINAIQNSFYFYGRKRNIPKAFLPVFNQLPVKPTVTRTPSHKQIKPTSVQAVKKSWQRLQRKMGQETL